MRHDVSSYTKTVSRLAARTTYKMNLRVDHDWLLSITRVSKLNTRPLEHPRACLNGIAGDLQTRLLHVWRLRVAQKLNRFSRALESDNVVSYTPGQ